mgnify:CR=1 FL=1
MAKNEVVSRKRQRMQAFMETDDPFVDYVLEDVYVRRMVGKDAVRARVKDNSIELYSMNEAALKKLVAALTGNEPFSIKVNKMKKPTPEDLQRWMQHRSELEAGDDGFVPKLPFLDDGEDEV